MKYITQVLLAYDQLLNAVLGGRADETISARAYRQQHNVGWNRFRCVINFLFFWQQDHCKQACLAELEQRRTAPKWDIA